MRSLRVRSLQIPFRQSFKHASAERSVTQSLWVEVRARTGGLGLGEGCPREYVTGESVESALLFVEKVRSEVATLRGIEELRAWVDMHRAQIDANPAAWCAIELALLDAMARERDQPVEQLLSLPAVKGPFHYTAVLGAGDLESFGRQLASYQRLGFRDFKVKLSGDLAADGARLKMLQEQRDAIGTVRLDANNLWADAERACAHLTALPRIFFAIEEPLRVGDHEGHCRIAETLGLQIILDESLLRLEQLDCLSPSVGPWILNVRISKLGGLLRSLAVVARAAQLGLPIILGCQVGETSLLTRAALTLAESAKSRGLVGQEGAFGTLLLASDIVSPSLTVGREGVLDVTRFDFEVAPGFGLTEVKADSA